VGTGLSGDRETDDEYLRKEKIRGVKNVSRIRCL
jgi:hypothetical protein